MGKLFVSYRREDKDFTARLVEYLSARIDGVIFVDWLITGSAADFAQKIVQEVVETNVYLLVVTKNTFASERIAKPDDWIRYEVRLALQYQKPIALALRENQLPPPVADLPPELHPILSKQGVPVYLNHFLEGAETVARHCVGISNGALRLREQPPNTPNSPPPPNYPPPIITGAPGGVTAGVIHGSQINIGQNDNRPQRLQALYAQRNQLRGSLALLTYRPRRGGTLESIMFWLAFILLGGTITFSLNPTLGLIVSSAIVVGAIATIGTQTSRNSARQRQIQQLQSQLQQVEYEIQRLEMELRQ